MENRQDLKSILAFLPSSSLFWPCKVVPIHSGHVFFLAISDIRTSLALQNDPLAPDNYTLFFDKELTAALFTCSLFCNRVEKDLPPINFDYLFALDKDQLSDALEVDFANKYIGGGALSSGCVQEEIRFMINPELIAGMLFLPSMADNEAIEIVGAERFSSYTGYASTFRFAGNYLDEKPIDCLGRQNTRFIAIDSLCNPKMRQYGLECLLRYQCYEKFFQDYAFCEGHFDANNHRTEIPDQFRESSSTTNKGRNGEGTRAEWIGNFHGECSSKNSDDNGKSGIVTGNWGCGAFGGDPEIKVIVQWLAASQALRTFILYYTFQEEALRYLDQVSAWMISHGWTVGDLWNMLLEYSCKRKKGETCVGFFTWLLPTLNVH